VLWAALAARTSNTRATPLELFFDLVDVFAATQVTAYVAPEHSLHGVVQGCCCWRPARRAA
jgi:low temperature requirement protein LtrA